MQGFTKGQDTVLSGDSQPLRRLKKEAQLARKVPAGTDFQIYAVDSISDDYMSWKATITPTHVSLYHGGKFEVALEFPLDYPAKPPTVQFLTKIFHPNIEPETGFVRVASIDSEWCPAYTGNAILRSIIADLDCPIVKTWRLGVETPEGERTTREVSYIVNNEAAKLWRRHRDAFETRVAEWLVMYAIGEDRS